MASDPNPIRVWLVEDNGMFRRNVQRVINNLDGIHCDGSFDSAEATFAALQDQPAPDVILLDVQLPGLDGIGALAKFKVLLPETQIVILTVSLRPTASSATAKRSERARSPFTLWVQTSATVRA